MDNTRIEGIDMISVYVTDFPSAFDFYHETIGLHKWFPMGEQAAFFTFGGPDEEDFGMYVVGGRQPANLSMQSTRTTFAFRVGSTREMFDKLQRLGVKTVQEEPMQMNEETYWFQCYDPSDNIIEFIGGK